MESSRVPRSPECLHSVRNRVRRVIGEPAVEVGNVGARAFLEKEFEHLQVAVLAGEAKRRAPAVRVACRGKLFAYARWETRIDR